MPRSAKHRKGAPAAAAARGLVSLNQEIANRLVGEYARCRQLSMAAWKRLGVGQRDALTRYRAAGFRQINGLLRGPGDAGAHATQEHTIDWSAIVNWSRPAMHWIMTPDTPGWGPRSGDCPLYETPIGSLGRLVDNVQAAISAAVVALDGVFSAKTAPVLPIPLTLFRGVRGETARAFAECKVGESVPESGFLSTSLSPLSARSFMGMMDVKNTKTNASCLLVIRVPAGVPFVFFDGITGAANDVSSEMEIMFPRSSALRKLSAGRETDDPDLHYRTAADVLDGKKGLKGRIVVFDCELVLPVGPPPPVPAHPTGEPTVKLFPSVVEEGRSKSCGYSRSTPQVFGGVSTKDERAAMV